jgi:hypothetical protein
MQFIWQSATQKNYRWRTANSFCVCTYDWNVGFYRQKMNGDRFEFFHTVTSKY